VIRTPRWSPRPAGSRHPAARFVAVGLACLAAGASCARDDGAPPRPLNVRPLEFQDLTPSGEPPCPVRAGAILALGDTGRSMGDESPRFRVAAGCADADGDGYVDIHAAVALELSAPGKPDATFDGMAIVACASPARAPEPFSLLACTVRAVGDALDVALARWRLAGGDDRALVEVLERASLLDRQVLMTAIGQAGDRRIRAAVPALVELLGHRDPDVVMRAIGSLGRLGDPRALPALGTLAVSPQPEVWHMALQAMADIGGPQGARALELVAGQAVEPVVIRQAVELLEAVRKRTDGDRP